MRRVFFLASFLLVFPLISNAVGNVYLEYNPDKSDYIKISNSGIPSQAFFAQSDFLSGFDFWIANPGSSGTATFQFLNEQGLVLTSKTAAIPAVPAISGGTRFHVDLSSQIPVLADKKYSIRITTSMPELRLYYSERIQLISHNAPFVSEYITGVGLLGNEEQTFSFKYALYESNETSAPIVSNLGWLVVSTAQMKTTFNANEAIDYKIEYGPSGQGYVASTEFMGDYKFCADGISDCIIAISVNPNTTYQYRLTAKDKWGNQSQKIGTFESGKIATPEPTISSVDASPVISNLRTVDLANNSTGIAWTTNEIATSRVSITREFDFSLAITSAYDNTFELEHYLATQPILSPNTEYLATVMSRDISGKETVASMSFVTLSVLPLPSPSLSPIPTYTPPINSPSPTPGQNPTNLPQATQTPQVSNPPQQLNINFNDDNSISIQWPVPLNGEPSEGYRIDVFDKAGNLIKSVLMPSGSHITDIPGLNNDEEYSVIVYENDEGVFKKVDKPVIARKSEDSFLKRLLGLWYLFTPVIILGGVLWWLRHRKIENVNIKMQNNNLRF